MLARCACPVHQMRTHCFRPYDGMPRCLPAAPRWAAELPTHGCDQSLTPGFTSHTFAAEVLKESQHHNGKSFMYGWRMG